VEALGVDHRPRIAPGLFTCRFERETNALLQRLRAPMRPPVVVFAGLTTPISRSSMGVTHYNARGWRQKMLRTVKGSRKGGGDVKEGGGGGGRHKQHLEFNNSRLLPRAT